MIEFKSECESQFAEFNLEEPLVNKLETFFDDVISKGNFVNNLNLCTVNGNQTKNVVHFLDRSLLQDVSAYVVKYLNEFYKNNLVSYSFLVDHVHAIRYEEGGYQVAHTHHLTEDHSFIVYLNDSNAVTKIFQGNSSYDIKNVKGKILVFNSSLLHGSTKCDGIRKILVGSVKFSQKKWIDRRMIS